MDTTIVDHERRLTRLEDRFEVNLQSLTGRIQQAEQGIARIDALTAQVADLAARVAALEALQVTATAGTIGLSPE